MPTYSLKDGPSVPKGTDPSIYNKGLCLFIWNTQDVQTCTMSNTCFKDTLYEWEVKYKKSIFFLQTANASNDVKKISLSWGLGFSIKNQLHIIDIINDSAWYYSRKYFWLKNKKYMFKKWLPLRQKSKILEKKLYK